MTNKGPLAGVTVVEMAAIGPVPWCGVLLRDMGARIIRVDRPSDPRRPVRRDPMTAGRESVVVDLKCDTGRARVLELVRSADALVEGMRPGVMERLGVGPTECLLANPRLVYGRMTGWGREGPLASRAGHDINYIGLTGALHAIGRAGEAPVIPLNIVGDYGGGGTFLAIGLLAALLDARSGGGGCVVDSAMIDGTARLMAMQYGRLATGEWQDQRGANILDGGAPWYDVYPTADGRFVAVGAIEVQFYEELLAVLGLDKATLPSREDRERWPELRLSIAQAFRARSRDDWEIAFLGRDACVTPVLSMSEAPLHPHNQMRATFVKHDDAYFPAPAPRFLHPG